MNVRRAKNPCCHLQLEFFDEHGRTILTVAQPLETKRGWPISMFRCGNALGDKRFDTGRGGGSLHVAPLFWEFWPAAVYSPEVTMEVTVFVELEDLARVSKYGASLQPGPPE